MEYFPLNLRWRDDQYNRLLLRILREGESVQTQQGEKALMVVGHQMRFDLQNGFPMITERDVFSGEKSIFSQALGELCAFLNGARTQKELESFGCFWWKPWLTEEKCEKRGLSPGDLGPGSYGPAWRSFPTGDLGQQYDQITNIVEQIKETPHLRTHFVSPWIPQYTIRGVGKKQKVVVAPCHGWMHFFVNDEKKTIKLHHFQRSADVPVGLAANLIQYAAMLMIMGQVTGYEPKELIYSISDAHIYEKQIDDVHVMLRTKATHFPQVKIDDSTIDDIFKFRQENFLVADYRPQLPRRRIWTPV